MRRIRLNGIAFLSALVYATTALHYGWRPTATNAYDDILEWLTVCALLLLYWAGYNLLRAGGLTSFGKVMLPAIPLVAISFATMPYDSTDVFFYMDIGWAQTHYGINPYSHVLHDIPAVEKDRMIRGEWMSKDKNPWLDLPVAYGFLFALLARGLAWIGHGHWGFTLALFKGLNVVAWAVCCRILWNLTKAAHTWRPDLCLYLFAWSPLILQHHIANAHNDLLVGCLVIVSTYLLASRQRAVLAPATLVAAALIKYVTLPLVPISLWLVAKKKGRREAYVAGFLSLVVIVLSSAPYISDLSSFRLDLISGQLNKTTAGSLYAFLFYVYRFTARFIALPASIETFGFLLKILLWSIGALVVTAQAYHLCRKPEPAVDDWIATSSRILFAIIFIASSQFYSWYVGMFLPLTLLLSSEDGLRSFSIFLSGTHLFSLTSLSRKGIGYFLLTLFPAVIRT